MISTPVGEPLVVELGDGCTLFPQGNWRQCCDAHDLGYAIGGDKLAIDLELARCVWDAGSPIAAVVMFVGVSIFGMLFWWKARRERHG